MSMIVLIVILLVILLMLAAVRPYRSDLSQFELQRRCEEQDKDALLNWRRQELFDDVKALGRLLERLLIVLIVSLLVIEYGVTVGLLGGLLAVVIYPLLASIMVVRAAPQIAYRRYELRILDIVDSLRGYTRLLRRRSDQPEASLAAASRQELQHIIESSSDVLGSDEAKIVDSAFNFADKLVKDYMTPRSKMEVIGAYEMLGPLVLDDLHKTGHSHFPVLDGDIDQIIGTLRINNLLIVSDKKTQMVQDVMDRQVYYVRQDQTLAEVLAICIKQRQHLLVVVDEFAKTVGVISVEDAYHQLIGREITGRYDDYDSLTKVVQRQKS